ncbi:MAG TPA: hypothetical protein VGI70_17750 [Polyangiales bacterium]
MRDFGFWIALSFIAACASSQANAPSAEHATANAPTSRPLPSDPLSLLVGAPSSVAIVRVDRVRASPLFARLRPMIEAQSCASSQQLDQWLAPTERAVIASRIDGDRIAWLALLSGHYSAEDADRMLAAAARAPADEPAAKQAHGRFELQTRGGLASSLLEGRLIAIGTPEWVTATLDAIDRPVPTFQTSPLWLELGAQVQCADRALCLLSTRDSLAAKRMQHALSSAGAKGLGRELGKADSAVAASIASGVEIAYLAKLESVDETTSALQQSKDLLWQAGLLIRLAGLPDVLGDAHLEANGDRLSANLIVNDADLDAYRERLESLLAGSSECPSPPSAAP